MLYQDQFRLRELRIMDNGGLEIICHFDLQRFGCFDDGIDFWFDDGQLSASCFASCQLVEKNFKARAFSDAFIDCEGFGILHVSFHLLLELQRRLICMDEGDVCFRHLLHVFIQEVGQSSSALCELQRMWCRHCKKGSAHGIVL